MPKLPQNARKDTAVDRCQTPSYALHPLRPYLRKEWTVWESAAGEGLLAAALEVYVANVLRSDILTGQDYFFYQPDHYDFECTNVPFSKKYAWLRLACERGKPFALLAPSTTMFAKQGQELIERYGIEILSPSRRINFKMPQLGWGSGAKRSSAQFHSSWFTRGLNIGQRLSFVEITIPKYVPQYETQTQTVEPPQKVVAQQTEFF